MLRMDLARKRRDGNATAVSHQSSGRTAITATYLMVAFGVFLGALAMPVFAQTAQQAQQTASQPAQGSPAQAQNDLTQTSVEDLLNVEVTSVSKKEQKLSHTAAAVFVITSEDIARSGATNIPDLLRMAPGMDVAQVNQNAWAISARGFNSIFANELLVMIDGRIVYSPTSGGVFWDVINVPLQDIERIEVIRGSGSSVWGTNAVNGIVNIITKKATDTHGGMIAAGGGSEEDAYSTVQYGGAAGSDTDYRVYAKYSNLGALNLQNGASGGDGSHMDSAGFRIDSTLSAKDTLSIQGSGYQGFEGTPTTFLPSITAPGAANVNALVPVNGGFVQGVWQHVSSERLDSTLQISYDEYYRGDVLNEVRKTFRADFQQHIGWGARQNFVWGLDFSTSDSDTTPALTFSLNPPNRNTSIGSAFVQDEIAIVRDKLYFTLGTKLEHDYYNGFDFMPTARILWAPAAHHTLWAAVSRSIRTPALLDAASRLNLGEIGQSGNLPVVLALFGNPNILNEAEVNLDAGYRAQLGRRLQIDLAAFFDHDTNQETTEPGTPFFEANPAPAHLVMPLMFGNLMSGEAHGLEAFGSWKVTERWTLSPGIALEEINMHLGPTSQDTGSVAEAEGSSPDVSIQLRSHVVLPHRLAWDTSAYYVSGLTDPVVAPYTRLDTGLTWSWSDNLSFSAFGQNLLKAEHLEFVDSTGSERSTLMKRGAYAKVTFTF